MSISEKLTQIAENEQNVYEAGKKKRYDDFWDTYQAFGKRTSYRCAFACGSSSTLANCTSWNETNLIPKYDIIPTESVDRMFMFNAIYDLEGHFNNIGIILDTSKCVNMAAMYQNAINHIIPTTSLESATTCNTVFGYANMVETIRKIIFSELNTNYVNMFVGCVALKNIVAEGVIAKSISFSDSPLTLESAESIISCLKNFSGTSNANTYKISFSSTTWAYLDEQGNVSPSGTTWREYIASLGWNC